MKKYYLLSIILALSLIGCGPEHNATRSASESENTNLFSGPVFELLSAEKSGITFRNDITETPEIHGLTWDAIYYGGGVGIGDINNDGLDDIVLTGNQTDDALYLNKGDMVFDDISKSSGIAGPAGWSTGVSMVDINADGFLDIYVCRSSWKMDNENHDFQRNKLFINNGDLTFTERSAEYGLDYAGYSTQATFLDFDKDGDLDLFLLNSPSNNLSQKVIYAEKNAFPSLASDRFYLNNNGKFKDITQKAGVEAFSFGLGVVAADLDHDTWVDIYVANDYDRPDYLYMNQKDGTFKNMLDEKIKHTAFTAMGCDAADINNDGLVDLGVLDMQSADHVRSKTNMPTMDAAQFWGYVNKGYNYQYMSNVLQLNNGRGYFSDIAQYAGIASSDWSWSILMADFNNDRHKDIVITNGINKDLRNNDFKVKLEKLVNANEKVDLFEMSKALPSNPLPNYVYENKGHYQFKNVNDVWGLDQNTFSFGAAYGDLDRDGDLDLVINNNNERSYIYRNTMDEKAHYISVDFKGYAQNPMALGTKVFMYQNGEMQYQELNPVRGYQSSCAPYLHFGLGNNDHIDSLVCIFPDDRSIRLYKVPADQRLTLSHADARHQKMQVYTFQKNIFTNNKSNSGVDFVHQENLYDDFKEEILLPHSESRKGPYQAVGDVNGDGTDDFFIGGARGQSGELYLQDRQGLFSSLEGPWKADAAKEDMGCAFFDMDGDGDLDLYVASGGNDSANPHDYHDRLYRNDGNGLFSKASDQLPELHANSSCVAVHDFDGDGDEDVFIGGLVEYARYPHPGQSVLLRNDEGIFTNVTDQWAPGLSNAGMVTAAIWADINGDQLADLILVGEWMKPTAFVNKKDHMAWDENWPEFRDQLSGWYMSISTGDINQDGRPDFVLGNFGTNNKFHPSLEKPLKVYSSDFDGNNTNDIVLAKNYKGKYVPLRGRQCSSEQMPFVADKFKTFSEFANASIENILEEKLETSLNLQVNEFRSGVLLSSSTGYTFKPLPAEAQFAPLMASQIHDFNKDGVMDILLVSNLFDSEVETTRHDAGNGLYLKGIGDDNFEALTVLNSGFYAPYNSRSMTLLGSEGRSGGTIIVGSNNNRVVSYTFE
jgi:hypothetical protein